MNKTEVEQIIKNANNSIKECENQIVKLEMVKAEAEKELKKSALLLYEEFEPELFKDKIKLFLNGFSLIYIC